jgi:hypothetical protein
MQLYIKNIGTVSLSALYQSTDFGKVKMASLQHPNYTALFKPMQLRRMGKLNRMAMSSAMTALGDTPQIDSIHIGTAFGCVEDTEAFLKKMVEQDEQMLTPTAFIQSTHNTVSGQIAVHYQCLGQNITYSQSGHSFAHALLGSHYFIKQQPNSLVLCGAIDELNITSHAMLKYALGPHWLDDITEGCTFMSLSDKADDALAKITEVDTWYNADTEKTKAVKVALTQTEVPIFVTSTQLEKILGTPSVVNTANIFGYFPTVDALALAYGIRQCHASEGIIVHRHCDQWTMIKFTTLL